MFDSFVIKRCHDKRTGTQVFKRGLAGQHLRHLRRVLVGPELAALGGRSSHGRLQFLLVPLDLGKGRRPTGAINR